MKFHHISCISRSFPAQERDGPSRVSKTSALAIRESNQWQPRAWPTAWAFSSRTASTRKSRWSKCPPRVQDSLPRRNRQADPGVRVPHPGQDQQPVDGGLQQQKGHPEEPSQGRTHQEVRSDALQRVRRRVEGRPASPRRLVGQESRLATGAPPVPGFPKPGRHQGADRHERGYRESGGSWVGLLRDCRRRGMHAPVLAVGNGALGSWNALAEVIPGIRRVVGHRKAGAWGLQGSGPRRAGAVVVGRSGDPKAQNPAEVLGSGGLAASRSGPTSPQPAGGTATTPKKRV